MTTTAPAKRVNLAAKPRVLRKVTLNFLPRNWAAIKTAADVFDLSQTETLNRAAALIGRAADAEANGGGIYIRAAEGEKIERVTFI